MIDAIDYLNSLGLHRVNPGLERITKVLSALGNPQDKMRSVIIGGTNGKGSVSAAIASVLKSEGYKSGLYTSPHLVRVSERIKINDGEISIGDLSRLILEIKKLSSWLQEELSYFEVLTACAFLFFAETKMDFSVLEVGMGGQWDATNIVNPLLSIITNVSKDHTEFLGETIGEIAFEKAGIIKRGVPVVTAAKGEALKIIEAVADEKSTPISVLERDFKTRGESTEDFSYLGKVWNLEHLEFALPGFYQIENASVVICAIESLSQFYGVKIREENLRKGLSSVRWEGRMEFLRENPPFILDGAHNPGGAQALRESLQKMFPGEKFVFLIGMLGDKDHEGYMSEISRVAERVVITDVPSERGIRAEELARIAAKFLEVEVIKDFREAFCKVEALSFPVCITGSLYLIGAIKKFIG
ncbi:MAG: bifunctional folylpolyglutamate synthase/dihydrofolate synthase [Ignavibacteriales bacterium]